MRFGSVCSGIEAASTAWHPVGWETAYVADIEPFPCAVLAARFGASRPVYMPDPEAVAWPRLWNEKRADAFARARVDSRYTSELSVDQEAALAALQDVRTRRAAIRAVADLPEAAPVCNFGDFTRIVSLPGGAPEVDLLVGGTPCQAFSIAGARQSLADARGNLTLQFMRLVHATKSLRWVVWENVPGVLSTDDNAFGCFLSGLVGGDAPIHVPGGGRWPDAGMVCGPLGRAAWRILDAQHFGLAQRRRRVFVVFCPRSTGGDPVAVLFERKGVRGHSAPGGQTREGIAGGAGAGADERCASLAPTPTSSGRGVERPGESRGQDPVVAVAAPDIARCITTREGNSQDFELTTMIAHTPRAEGFDASDGAGRGTPLVPVAFMSTESMSSGVNNDISPTLRVAGDSGNPPAIVFAVRGREGGAQAEVMGERTGALRASQGGSSNPFVGSPSAVRRLTPRECERLQGFPDDHTLITWKGKEAPDGPRYKALGNSMAVPVMRWIGERIAAFEAGRLDEWRADFLREPARQERVGSAIPILEAGARTGKSTTDPRAGMGVGQDGDPMFTLQAGKQHAVAQ